MGAHGLGTSSAVAAPGKLRSHLACGEAGPALTLVAAPLHTLPQRGRARARCRGLRLLGICPRLLSRSPGRDRWVRNPAQPPGWVAQCILAQPSTSTCGATRALTWPHRACPPSRPSACSGHAGPRPHHHRVLRPGGQLPPGCGRRLPGAGLFPLGCSACWHRHSPHAPRAQAVAVFCQPCANVVLPTSAPICQCNRPPLHRRSAWAGWAASPTASRF